MRPTIRWAAQRGERVEDANAAYFAARTAYRKAQQAAERQRMESFRHERAERALLRSTGAAAAAEAAEWRTDELVTTTAVRFQAAPTLPTASQQQLDALSAITLSAHDTSGAGVYTRVECIVCQVRCRRRPPCEAVWWVVVVVLYITTHTQDEAVGLRDPAQKCSTLAAVWGWSRACNIVLRARWHRKLTWSLAVLVAGGLRGWRARADAAVCTSVPRRLHLTVAATVLLHLSYLSRLAQPHHPRPAAHRHLHGLHLFKPLAVKRWLLRTASVLCNRRMRTRLLPSSG